MEQAKLKPSQEMRWQKYYPESAQNFDFPKVKIYDAVYEENRNKKDNVALEYEGTEIKYGEFFDKVEEKTEYFLSKGVEPGEVVTFTMLMSPEFVYDWYALSRIGAVSNLIDPRTNVAGIREYIKEADSKLILNTGIFTNKVKDAIEDDDIAVVNYSLKDSAKKMPLLLGTVSSITDFTTSLLAKKDIRFQKYDNSFAKSKSSKLEGYTKDEPLTIVHTGGTTGMPKGVVLSHDNYNAMAYEYIKSGIGFTRGDRFLLIMPPWISYGSGMLHMSLVCGMKATIISKLDSKKMPNYILKHQPQWFAGVPVHYQIVNRSKDIKPGSLSFLKAGAVGGGAVSGELFEESEAFLLKNGAKKGVYPGYALTESTSAFAVRHTKEFKKGSSGIPLPGCTVGIFKFDENTGITTDEELDYNQRGEICLKTRNMMLGYFKNDELTKEVLKKHSDGETWIHTGDLGKIDEDGFIFIEGRIKEMITRHDGFKVYPSVIERVISAHKAIDSCKVVGVPDTIHQQGEFPKVYFTIKEEYKKDLSTVLKELKDMSKSCLPEYYLEGISFESIDKMPLTPLGKIDYRKLQELNVEGKILKKIK